MSRQLALSNLPTPSFSVTATAMLMLTLPLPSLAFEAIKEAEMATITGQAGVTIEMEALLSIGQIRWQDQGNLDINNLRISGHNGANLDNLKITLDLAGDGEVLEHGFSELARRGNQGLLSSLNADVADAMSHYTLGSQTGKEFNDGDLVIHIGPTDSGDPASLNDYLRAVDFEIGIDSIATGDTNMFSDINLQGYLGPTDIVVRNSAPGATRILDNGNTVSQSEVQLSSHFEITHGSLNWEVADVILIFNLAGVSIDGLQMHNRRGEDTLGHFGMASVDASLAAGTSAQTGVEGLSVHDLEFRADIDMPVFRLGSTTIGEVNFTDFALTSRSLLVYGH